MYSRVKLYGRKETILKLCVQSCSINPCYLDGIKPKPFENIPGPRSFPIIGTLYKYLPFIGKHNTYFDD